MRIAFVSLQKDAERVPPVGLVYLATWLNEKEGIPKEDIRILEANYCDIEKDLDDFKPDIIGFTSMTVDYGKVCDFANNIRNKHNALFIIGGVHISTLPESFRGDIFDMGVIGEGEQTISEILHDKWNKLDDIKGIVYSEDGAIIKTEPREPIKNLDELPIPNYDFIDKRYFKKEEMLALCDIGTKGYLISSRGCPYRCSFCSTSRFWGCMRFHSPEKTAKIAKSLIEKHGVDFIKVMDDLFTVSPERVNQIREAFEQEGILEKIKGIECQPRANLMNDELCEAMKKLKIKTLNFGFESGSNRMLKYLKGDNSDISINMTAILLCEKHGFNCYGSLIYGSPGETIKDMELTNDFIDFAMRHKAKYLWSFVATPFPATPFWELALKNGSVSNNMDWNILSHHNSINALLLDKNIRKEDFLKIFEEGRNKLKSFKIKMIIDIIKKKPIGVVSLLISDPQYYISRFFKQVLGQ